MPTKRKRLPSAASKGRSADVQPSRPPAEKRAQPRTPLQGELQKTVVAVRVQRTAKALGATKRAAGERTAEALGEVRRTNEALSKQADRLLERFG